MRDVGNDRAQVHGHGLAQGAAGELDHGRKAGGGRGQAPADGGAKAHFADHVEVGHIPLDLWAAPELRHVHQERQASLGAQQTPAFDVIGIERIFQEADDRKFFQFIDDAQHGRSGPIVVEVPVDLKAIRRDFLGGARLFDHVVLFGRVHLEDGVALLGGALDFAGKVLGGRGPGPRGHGHAVADLLAQQFIRRLFDGLAHGVVQRAHQAGAERASDVVERRLVNHAGDLPFGERGVAALVAVADDAVVQR